MLEFKKIRWDQGDIVSNGVSKYKVLDVKEGGMGIIYIVEDLQYESRDPGLDRPRIYAAKSLIPEYSGFDFLKDRFLKEAKNWILIEPHPNILKAYFADVFLGIPFVFADYIEEYVLPNTLLGFIEKDLLNPEVGLYFLVQLLEGLEHAYTNNIEAHGDLKPGNILIDKSGFLKIADWGLSRISSDARDLVESYRPDWKMRAEDQHQTLVHRGTPGYAAPEVDAGLSLPKRASDVFSLGVIAGEVFTGRRFVSGVSKEEISSAMEARYDTPKEVKTALAGMIAGFLEKDPDLRMAAFEPVKKEISELLFNLIDLRPDYYSITIKQKDFSWMGPVGFSMMRLGDHAKAIQYQSELVKSTRQQKGEEDQEDSAGKFNGEMVIHDLDTGEWAIPQKVLQEFEADYKNDPGNLEKLIALANFYEMSKAYQESRALFEKGFLLDNRDRTVIAGLITAALHLKDPESAIRYAQHLVETFPGDEDAWLKYAQVCDDLELFEQGLAVCREAERRGLLSPKSLLIYGHFLSNTGQIEQALEKFQELVELDGENGWAWYNLAYCQRILGRPECYESFEKVLEKGGPEGQTYNHMASLKMESGELGKAIELLRLASEFDSRNPKIWFNLGQCNLALDDPKEAARYFSIALSLKPDYALARAALDRLSGR